VLAALMMIVMMFLMAFAVDLGYVMVAKTELQRTADAAAVAATWDLISEDVVTGASPDTRLAKARDSAQHFTLYNEVCANSPAVDRNDGNVDTGDVVVGQLADPTDPTSTMTFTTPGNFNAVKVHVRKTTTQNGEIPFFFARAFGYSSVSTEIEATAATVTNFSGFTAPSDGSNLELLPFALDQDTWNALLAGTGTDNWRWNKDLARIESGSDGIKEVNLYPQGTGSPGNRGTVDIGSSNNSTADIARQILDGVSPADLAYHGGSLEFDATGKLDLNGDTGISAGVKDELAAIKGQPRIIPIFSTVVGPGNNATYSIVKFVGVRIMNVKLTGSMSGKQVIIQPAAIVTRGGIPSPGAKTSWYVFSPVSLVK
jgi:hypothetical protein